MTDLDEADDTDREPDPAPEERTAPPSPVLTTKKSLVPISTADVHTVPGEIVRRVDAEWHEPPPGSSREWVVPANRPFIEERERGGTTRSTASPVPARTPAWCS